MNNKLLESFVAYCKKNPKQRFWQALTNWSGHNFIFVSDAAAHDDHTKLMDVYYREIK